MVYFFELSNGVAFWAAIGTFYLLLMTFKDLFRGMRIDDRHNYMMYGVTLMLLTHFKVSIWYLLGLIAVIFLMNIYFNKFKILGGADVSAFTWLFYGYGIIGYQPLVLFVVTLIFLSVLYYVVRAIMKIPDKIGTPYFPVIFAAFLLTNIIWHLY